jgi:hypothetical protein
VRISRRPASTAAGGSPQQERIADRVGRRELHQSQRVGGEVVEPPPEALLDPSRHAE